MLEFTCHAHHTLFCQFTSSLSWSLYFHVGSDTGCQSGASGSSSGDMSGSGDGSGDMSGSGDGSGDMSGSGDGSGDMSGLMPDMTTHSTTEYCKNIGSFNPYTSAASSIFSFSVFHIPNVAPSLINTTAFPETILVAPSLHYL